MKQKVINTHTVKHMWEAYSAKLIERNPEYWGKSKHKIKRYFVYKSVDGQVKEVNSYERFRRIIEQFADKAKRAVINGQAININKCGKICAKRVQRDFRKKKQRNINFGATNKQEKVWDPIKEKMVPKRIIYHVDDDWCRISWFKIGIKNETVYDFAPAHGNSDRTSGFKLEFSNKLLEDKLHKYQFLYESIRLTKPNRKQLYEDDKPVVQ